MSDPHHISEQIKQPWGSLQKKKQENFGNSLIGTNRNWNKLLKEKTLVKSKNISSLFLLKASLIKTQFISAISVAHLAGEFYPFIIKEHGNFSSQHVLSGEATGM